MPASATTTRRPGMGAASPSTGSAASSAPCRATSSRSPPRSAASSVRPEDPASFDRSPWVGGLNFEVLFDYSYDGIMRSYEQALQRLALDTVDALVIHDLDVVFHSEERRRAHETSLRDSGMKALEELKRSGDIAGLRHGHQHRRCADRHRQRGRPRLRARRHALHAARPGEPAHRHGGLREARRLGDHRRALRLGHPRDRLGRRGATTATPRRRRRSRPRCAASRRCARAHGVSLPAAALQFVLAHPAVVSVIPGAARPSEVRENVAALERPIPAAFWSDLKAEGLIDPASPVPEGPVRMADARPDRLRQRPRHLQAVRRRRGAARRRSRPDGGRDPCAARRERRRQVDLRQDPRRRPPAEPRHAVARRPAGRHRQPDRRAEARHHPDPPGADLVSRPVGRREPRPRARPRERRSRRVSTGPR